MKFVNWLTLLLFLIFITPGFGLAPQQRDLSRMLWEEIVKISFETPMDGSHLSVPNVLNVDILTDATPKEVVVRGGTVGTGGDTTYVEVGRSSKRVKGPTGFARFKVPLTTCAHLGNRLEIEAIGMPNRYKVYTRMFECQASNEPSSPPATK